MKKWFEREFNLSFSTDRYAAIYEQLKGAPGRLASLVTGLPEEVLIRKPAGKWSIKEHVGHLAIMEPLWRIRLVDIRERKPVLTTADLNNTATTEGGFNGFGMEELVGRFVAERQETLQLLSSIDGLDEESTSMHPRLKQPMRIIDLAYFVAEHDEHHFAVIGEML